MEINAPEIFVPNKLGGFATNPHSPFPREIPPAFKGTAAEFIFGNSLGGCVTTTHRPSAKIAIAFKENATGIFAVRRLGCVASKPPIPHREGFFSLLEINATDIFVGDILFPFVKFPINPFSRKIAIGPEETRQTSSFEIE